LQKEPVNFGIGHLLASFVAPAPNETLFVGLYRVEGVSKPLPGTMCLVLQIDRGLGGHLFFDIQPDSRLSKYIGLLIIEWGTGFRSWIQRAERQQKPVLEIRREVFDPAFPGLREFRYDSVLEAIAPTASLEDVTKIESAWKDKLRTRDHGLNEN